ncbi:MAG: 5'-deoxyadenosine deaminase [Ignavibacteriae bacterium]|nr:5'-deoxyadenosine deaminase [Ignavibacteriota bacterium]
MKTLLKLSQIVTMDARRRVIAGGGLVVSGNVIESVLSANELRDLRFDGEVIEAGALVAIPGFIQTHIHLCQTLFRGLADDLELLDWLKLRIMPYEAAHTAQSLRASAMIGIAELLRSGTTTIMDMGTVHHEEEIIRAVAETGVRAFVGKAMMDVNELHPPLRESTKDAIRTTREYAEHAHGLANGRIRYAVAPRFILSCTDALMEEAYEMTQSFPGMLFHTHAAENKHEMTAVRSRCGMDNVEYFDRINILHQNTCLAHCIWLNDREVDLMAERDAKVLHCPSSNLKLGSGVARIPLLRAKGVTVSLGADGAPCNNTLNIFEEMRLAALIQKPGHGPTAMDAQSVFEMATLGGAATLGISNEVGSLEPGMKADLVLLDLNKAWNPYSPQSDSELYSSIVYSCSPENVDSVMVDGRWVFRGSQHLGIDEHKIVESAKNELRLLLPRVSG